MIAIVILAAGASSRMRGADKLMQDVDGVPLLRLQAMRALATGCHVLVTLPPAPHPRYDALDGLAVTQVAVENAHEGMNASLNSGLNAVPHAAYAAMIVLADMPDLTEGDFNTVLQAIDIKSEILIWRATTQSGAQGHPIVFHADLFPALKALEGDQGGAAVVKAHPDRTKLIPLPADHARTDLDTPEAWATWRGARLTHD